MKILFLSHTYNGGCFHVGSHHYGSQCAGMGISALHVSTPVTYLHKLLMNSKPISERIAFSGAGAYEINGLKSWVPAQILPCGFIIRTTKTYYDIGCIVNQAKIRNTLKALNFDEVDLVLLDQPTMIGYLKYINYKRLVYRATDVYHLLHKHSKLIRRSESLAVEMADKLVATSLPVKTHLQQYRSCKGKDCLVLENGVDLAHFRKKSSIPAEFSTCMNLRIIYVGALDSRFDHEAVAGLARSEHAVEIILIGPVSMKMRNYFNKYPHVQCLGSRPYSEIPGYLQHADIAILPLSERSGNEGRSPMKIYEYLSVGLPVVARATAELQRRNLANVYLYSSRNDFAAAVRSVMDNRYFAPMDNILHAVSWENRTVTLLDYALSEHV
jgi:glycosyltransferase involved in cell wall biosynthesis